MDDGCNLDEASGQAANAQSLKSPRYGRSKKKKRAAAAALLLAEEEAALSDATDAASAQPPPQCAYFMQAKQRFCRMQPTAGNEFCGNHAFISVGDGKGRVNCPADPGHTVLLSEMEAHLRKCPGRQNALQEMVRGGFRFL